MTSRASITAPAASTTRCCRETRNSPRATCCRARAGAAGGSQDGGGGDGEDAFRFVLSREEFLDLFLDDLELPDLAKRRLAEVEHEGIRRAGYAVSGSPVNIAVARTMRLRLGAPHRLAPPEPAGDPGALKGRSPIARMSTGAPRCRPKSRRSKPRCGAFPISIRSTCAIAASRTCPKPVAQAVMFCLMDVSGSMSEHMKDLAKRFYMLLYIFLTRRYRHVEIVFIRHTDRAEEVDEETFFHSPATGGTVVSSAFEAMKQHRRGALSPGGLEHLRGAGVGRRQFLWRRRDDRPAAARRHPAGPPIFRLSRSRRRGRAEAGASHSSLWGVYENLCAPAAAARHAQGQRARRNLPGVPRICSSVGRATRGPSHDAPWRSSGSSKAPIGILRRCSESTTPARSVALGELGLNVYPNQIEVITSEQMLDAYSSVGMPLYYRHWSFGKHFSQHEGALSQGPARPRL